LTRREKSRVDALAGVAALNHAVAALAEGRMIVVVDDEQRENECDCWYGCTASASPATSSAR